MAIEETEIKTLHVAEMVDRLVGQAQQALRDYMKLDQTTIDEAVKQMALAGLEAHRELAKMA
nr:hypothetical protein [Bacilli bacterium]